MNWAPHPRYYAQTCRLMVKHLPKALMLALLLGGCTSNFSMPELVTRLSSGLSQPTASEAWKSPEAWDSPVEFIRYNDTIAWRWLEGAESSCGDSRCIQVEVITKNGCPSLLYVKASITDKQGRNVGYTNDTTSGVKPEQRAVLTMPDVTGGQENIQGNLEEISCS